MNTWLLARELPLRSVREHLVKNDSHSFPNNENLIACPRKFICLLIQKESVCGPD